MKQLEEKERCNAENEGCDGDVQHAEPCVSQHAFLFPFVSCMSL